MDRAYFNLLEQANEISRLSVAIVKNANHKEEIMNATAPVLTDVIHELMRSRNMLQEVIVRQSRYRDYEQSL